MCNNVRAKWFGLFLFFSLEGRPNFKKSPGINSEV